ncbi:hypothetical protein CYLTODRAFT_441964 [Cylindrobasidium torrendii FP15055 ss-10]|uniref:Uncharacterized protein n=1 Tax=Cylindrobasidium torrendii FP15055 ss-10 TaxID=1314674 RepID=A0A0D7BIY3_9AGAR|nr:hypothetical protein CYLTODRAFT_441964 [Cylindrobasidium torrendii FP15055 ss-10]
MPEISAYYYLSEPRTTTWHSPSTAHSRVARHDHFDDLFLSFFPFSASTTVTTMAKSSHSSAAPGSEAHESSHQSSTSGSKRWKTLRTRQRWWPFHKRHGSRGGSSVTGSEAERSENAEAGAAVPRDPPPPSQAAVVTVNGDRSQRVADPQASATADTLDVPDQPIAATAGVKPPVEIQPSVDSQQSVGIQASQPSIAVEPSADVPPNVDAHVTVSTEPSNALPVATPDVSDISLEPPLLSSDPKAVDETGHAVNTRRPVNLDADTHSRSSRFYEEDNSETDRTARGPTGSTTYIPIEDTRPRDSAVPTVPDDDSAGHAKEDIRDEGGNEEGDVKADVERTSKGLDRYPARVVDMRPPSPEPDEERQRHISEIQTSTQPLTSAPMDPTRPAPEEDSEPTTKKKRSWICCC